MHELLLFHTRAEQTVQHKLAELVKKTEQELEELKAAAKGKELEHKDCVNAVSLLEKYVKEHGNNRDGMLQNLKEKIKATKSKLQSCLKDLEGHENEREKLVMKMEAVVQEKALLEAELDALETRINRLTLEIEEQGAKVFSVKSSNERAQFELHDSFEGEGM